MMTPASVILHTILVNNEWSAIQANVVIATDGRSSREIRHHTDHAISAVSQQAFSHAGVTGQQAIACTAIRSYAKLLAVGLLAKLNQG